MATYYEILKVSPKASRAEIKSAYRKLARKLHPDAHTGSEETALAFAGIAEAYEVLSDPHERAAYDRRLLEYSYNGSSSGSSVFASKNSHARRWRQMAYERRYNEIIDRMIADERRESIALQKIIFPLVGLFISIVVTAALKPQVFVNTLIIGQIIIVSLFAAGTIHLYGRIREAIDRYTYNEDDLHDSILDDNEPTVKPYSRIAAIGFIAGGCLLSLLAGLAVGHFLGAEPRTATVVITDTLTPEAILYPPIFVLFVDLVHSFASRVDA